MSKFVKYSKMFINAIHIDIFLAKMTFVHFVIDINHICFQDCNKIAFIENDCVFIAFLLLWHLEVELQFLDV